MGENFPEPQDPVRSEVEEPEEVASDWDLDPALDTEQEAPVEDSDAPPSEPSDDAPHEPNAHQVADLMEYLEDLADFLPEDKKQQLHNDSVPLKMQKIRHNLGQPEPDPSPWPVKGEEASVTRQKLNDIMKRLKEKLAE